MHNMITLEFNGVIIGVKENEMVNMTHLWKSSGAKGSQEIKHWITLPSTNKFIDAVANKLKVRKSDLLEIHRGRTGGTYGHWQIALAYAKYLSPELLKKR